MFKLLNKRPQVDKPSQCEIIMGPTKIYGRHIFDFAQTVNEQELKRSQILQEMEEKNRRILCGSAEDLKKPKKKN